jgi:hypothetical protein
VMLELAVFLGGRSVKNIEAKQDEDKCRYCGAKLGGATFCPNCGRAAE